MSEAPDPYPDFAHGIEAWPFGEREREEARPDRLPNGESWPEVQVIILSQACADAVLATHASVARQDYPEAVCEVADDVASANAMIAARSDDRQSGYLLILRAGDLLSPGALTALCLEAALSDAKAVAGLRVLYDHGVHGLDVIDTFGFVEECCSSSPFSGGEILLARVAFAQAGGFDPESENPLIDLWRRLESRELPISRIGRPVLLVRDDGGASRPPGSAALSIASLTGLGHAGGAGIAHRRLTESLELAGHRISHFVLGEESPSAAAEWTDRFPSTEAAILKDAHDLVLAGNLHGVTRSVGILDRLSDQLPVAAVLHDLFLLTGRCAHPKACPVIRSGCDASCPSPDEYPQLAPRRIAGAHAEKLNLLRKSKGPLLLANSVWTHQRARDLAPAQSNLARINLAFPTGIFRPQDRRKLRRQLGLPEQDILVLVSAVIADAPDKGFADLVATMAQVARPGIGFVAVGRLDDPRLFKQANVYASGPIGDEALLAQWYGACDIYLTASRLETLGQTPIEAGLCGTPTVAYRATGLTSAVLDGVTGLLVDPHKPGALAEGLQRLIDDVALRRRLGAFARIVHECRFSHAAAAISLHAAFAKWDATTRIGNTGRIRFAPEMLGQFAIAKQRSAGAIGLVSAPSPSLVRSLRSAKHALFGRGMPLWIRRVAYAVALARRSPSLLVSRR